MQSYTRQIAEFMHGLRVTDIPAEVTARAKRLMLDGFGCGLYASDVKWTQIMAGMIRSLEPQGGQATVWGRRESASAASAVLINGTMVQGYEIDDGSSAGSFHGCCVVLPAALAAAEYRGADKVDGATLLRAVVAGFEIGPRVARCVDNAQLIIDGWHAPAVVSSFPAAIVAGIVLGLDEEQLFQALGIAGTQACGLMAAQYGSMVKRMQCAKNAQGGLYGALLAAGGFTGIEDIFDQEYGGYCSTFTHSKDGYKLDELVDGLGKSWHTLQAAIKIYACRGGNHTAINAIEELMTEGGLKAQDVESITVGVTEAAVSHGGWWPYEPKGLTAAQMHIGFCVAMQLIEGDVFVEQMVEENVARPDLVELANRVRVVHSVEREKKGFEFSRGADVEVRLKSGTLLRKSVDYRPGSDRRPLTDAQMSRKFRRMAAKVLSADKISEMEKFVAGIERASNIEPLIALLRG